MHWANRRPEDAGTDLAWYYRSCNAVNELGLPFDQGPSFICDKCGRLADVLDAADSAINSWFSLEVPNRTLRQFLRQEEAVWDGSPIRPGLLEQAYGMSFEDAAGCLEDGLKLGLLVRSGPGYHVAPPLCSPCYEARAEALANPAPRIASNRDTIPPQVRFRVLQRDAFRCQYCGRSARDGATLHLDHVVPVSAGGETTEENLLTACETCNLGKSASSVLGT